MIVARLPTMMDLTTRIAQIPDFPKPGILFYDISPLLGDGAAWRETVVRLANRVRAFQPDLLVGIESRGFLAAAPVAYELGIGFAMVRKRGKLPGGLLGHDYALEYGTDRVEMQHGAVKKRPTRGGAGRFAGDGRDDGRCDRLAAPLRRRGRRRRLHHRTGISRWPPAPGRTGRSADAVRLRPYSDQRC